MMDLIIFSPVILLVVALIWTNYSRRILCFLGLHKFGNTITSHGIGFCDSGVYPIDRNLKKCVHCGKIKAIK